MPGYDAEFLGLPAPAPTVAVPTVQLDYLHFSVAFRPDRRLAAVTGVNIQGGLLIEIERTRDVSVLDPRVPAIEQAGPELYIKNDFDRGHLVRRRDPGWGTQATAQAANTDTFHYTNAAPQAAQFNQSKLLWAGLEDYLLEHAATFEQRLAVFTAPVLDPGDPFYRGVQIPRRFWKVAAWIRQSELAATGYVLDQTDLIGPILAADALAAGAQPPPLGAYRTFQVPLVDIADAAGVRMPELVAADVLQPAPAGTAAVTAASSDSASAPWIELTSLDDIRL